PINGGKDGFDILGTARAAHSLNDRFFHGIDTSFRSSSESIVSFLPPNVKNTVEKSIPFGMLFDH
ncbi:MAG TPA: hypothetical protein PLZ76_04390, partial [Bacillota bacterium]|nr:hypothetical protein [Bacillota bacterium]